MRIHVDTDIGTDPDDACAIAMLLGWPGVDLAGITTTADPAGRRAGYLDHLLRLVGRTGIPAAAGAAAPLSGRVAQWTTTADPDHETRQARSTIRVHRPTVRAGVAAPHVPGEEHWPSGVTPRPSPAGEALDLLERAIEQGATVVAIGPLTNLALLELARPGILGRVPVVVMGGWLDPPAPGLPPWGPDRDTNLQSDPYAAQVVLRAASRLTLVTLPVTLKAHLRAADLPRLRATGRLGEHLADQSLAHAGTSGKGDLGPRHPALPYDFLNFHYDPVTCAVAAGWPGAVTERVRVRPTVERDLLRLHRDDTGHPVDVVVDLDGDGFTEVWLNAVAAAAARA